MPKLTIDGVELDVPAWATGLQACEMASKEIPHLYYHLGLSIAEKVREAAE